MIPKEKLPFLPNSPENQGKGFIQSNEWWVKKRAEEDGANLVQVASLSRPGLEAMTARLATTGPIPGLAIGPLPEQAWSPAPAPAPVLRAEPGPRSETGSQAEVGAGGPWRVVIGPADLEPRPAVLDLTYDHLVVHGEPRSGRSTALATVARQLGAAGVELWVVGAASSPLGALADQGAVDRARLAFGRAGDVRPLLAELGDLVGGTPSGGAPDGGPARALLIDDWDLLEDPLLDPVAGALVAAGLRLVVSTTTLRGYSTNPLTQELRKARSLLLLQPAGSREVQELTGVNPRLRPGVPMPPGRGVLVTNRVARLVQVARRPE